MWKQHKLTNKITNKISIYFPGLKKVVFRSYLVTFYCCNQMIFIKNVGTIENSYKLAMKAFLVVINSISEKLQPHKGSSKFHYSCHLVKLVQGFSFSGQKVFEKNKCRPRMQNQIDIYRLRVVTSSMLHCLICNSSIATWF